MNENTIATHETVFNPVVHVSSVLPKVLELAWKLAQKLAHEELHTFSKASTVSNVNRMQDNIDQIKLLCSMKTPSIYIK